MARVCMAKMELKPIPAVVDGMDNKIGQAYAGHPDRMFLVGRDGKIAYAGGRGPRGFRPEELADAIKVELKKKNKQQVKK